MAHIIDQAIRLLIALYWTTIPLHELPLTGKCAWSASAECTGVETRETNVVCEMKGEESKTIFSINGADSFRRRAAYALAAGTALWLYLSLSFSLLSHQRLSLGTAKGPSFLFLPRENICFCLLATKGSEFQTTWWVGESGARKRSEMRCTLHQAVFK